MASPRTIDDEDDFGSPTSIKIGRKRTIHDLGDEVFDIFNSSNDNHGSADCISGGSKGMILSLRESLRNCKDSLAARQIELESSKSELHKWHSAFGNESSIPISGTPNPDSVFNCLCNLKSSQETMKLQLEKANKKEAAFLMMLARRDQEIAELKGMIRDLKSQLKPPSMQARKLLLDPAIHEEFTRLKNLAEEKDKKVKELEEHIGALTFTPQSKMGKLLTAKCNALQAENIEIGQLYYEGKIQEMTMKLALQKSHTAKLRNQLDGLFKYVEVLDDEFDKSNEAVLILQEKIAEKDSELKRLSEELSSKERLEVQSAVTSNQEMANEC